MEAEVRETDYPHRRRPWVAVLLTLVMPGLGQVYCGAISSGITIMLVVAMFSSLWMFGMMRGGAPVTAFSMMMWGIVLLASLFAAIDAYRRARRTRYDYKLKDYNHWSTYLALVWIGGAGTVGYTAMIKMNMCEAFRVPNYNMAPTVMAGERLTANKMVYRRSEPKRGDVVLFDNPENRKQNQIKRIVAMAGETVEVKDGVLIIDGQSLERQWVEKIVLPIDQQKVVGDVFWETNGAARYRVFISSEGSVATKQKDNFGPVTVPAYQCFVMGDNRYYTRDSRDYGSISLGAIRGRFQAIYWPYRRRAVLNAQP